MYIFKVCLQNLIKHSGNKFYLKNICIPLKFMTPTSHTSHKHNSRVKVRSMVIKYKILITQNVLNTDPQILI